MSKTITDFVPVNMQVVMPTLKIAVEVIVRVKEVDNLILEPFVAQGTAEVEVNGKIQPVRFFSRVPVNPGEFYRGRVSNNGNVVIDKDE